VTFSVEKFDHIYYSFETGKWVTNPAQLAISIPLASSTLDMGPSEFTTKVSV
jgi:hypothetical protein